MLLRRAHNGSRARDAATESRYGGVMFPEETRLVDWNASIGGIDNRARYIAPVPRTIIFSPMRYRLFFQSQFFLASINVSITYVVRTCSNAWTRSSFCCLSRHWYIHKAVQWEFIYFFPFPSFFSPFLSWFSSSLPLPLSFSLRFVTVALSRPWYE